jgi:hypothetical protein
MGSVIHVTLVLGPSILCSVVRVTTVDAVVCSINLDYRNAVVGSNAW